MTNTTVLGVRWDTSRFAVQINYCFHLVQYCLWVANTKQNLPCLLQYLLFLNSKCDIELNSNCWNAKKGKPLVDYNVYNFVI